MPVQRTWIWRGEVECPVPRWPQIRPSVSRSQGRRMDQPFSSPPQTHPSSRGPDKRNIEYKKYFLCFLFSSNLQELLKIIVQLSCYTLSNEPTENKYRTRFTSVCIWHGALKFCTFLVIRIHYFIHTWRLSDLKRMSKTTRLVSLEILRLSSVWRWRMSTRDCRGRVGRCGLLH